MFVFCHLPAVDFLVALPLVFAAFVGQFGVEGNVSGRLGICSEQ